ncbi:MAG: PGF-CTERM sorting domain-containing protein [Haloferacaceae archaeon]
MSDRRAQFRAASLALLTVLSVVAGALAFAGPGTAATNVSISPNDHDAGASSVTYTAEGNAELANQDTLQYVDVHLGPADVSAVGSGDIAVFIDGNEYTDGFTQFSASDGTVEFKLSNSRDVSDGDPVRIVVTDVTNPSDDFTANATLHDTGDDRWQTFRDDVSIDTGPNITYSNLSAGDTTVAPGEDVTVSATVTNTGEQSGTYDASLKVDGTVRQTNSGSLDGGSQTTTSFVTSFSSSGTYDVTIEDLGAIEVTVTDTDTDTGSVSIIGGSADPATVDSGTTVNNQKVHVTVADVSQDGDTDTHYIEFPNALAGGLSINSVDANATSVTSSPNLVDGYDNDGTDDTVKFTTGGDEGGDVDLRLTADVSVDYPDVEVETTYEVDARVKDSDGGIAQRSDVVAVEVGGGASDGSGGGASDGSGGGASNSTDDSSTAPMVHDFRVEETDLGVTVEVVTDTRVDELRVALDGPVDVVLTRSSFTREQVGGNYVYTADLRTSAAGTVRGRLKVVSDGGSDGARGQTDTAVVEAPPETAVGGVASPPWVGDQSRHTFVVPVQGIENETLRNVTVAYSDAFTNASGSATSVSDDQNVVTLKVVGADGSVKSRMGGTDAVSVNVVNGGVRIDLTDVDSSRTPTLSPGDRVVVGIRPVTNPNTAGTYATDVVLESTQGTVDVTTTSVRIRNASETTAFASSYVPATEDRASIALEKSPVLDRVTVDSAASSNGILRVAVPGEHADAAAKASGNVLTTMQISRPPAAQNSAANISVRISTADLAADADALVIARYNATADRWHRFHTDVTSRSQGHATLTITTGQTSTFAVIAPAESGQSDVDGGTATGTATQGTAGEETETGGPGFGVLVALVALLAAAALARRRR